MSKPLIHNRRGFVPASKVVSAAGESLRAIKEADGLSWKDMGEALGKSEDQISKYALGTAEMPMTSVFRAIDLWNGRFANPVLSLFGQHISDNISNSSDIHVGKVSLVELLLLLERALLDGEIDDPEIDAMASTVESAGALIDGLRDRVAVRREAKAALRIVKEG
jgi:transcriptional regulator with XRE-family HTH domain